MIEQICSEQEKLHFSKSFSKTHPFTNREWDKFINSFPFAMVIQETRGVEFFWIWEDLNEVIGKESIVTFSL